MVIEYFWKSVLEFFKNIPTIFLAVVFGLIVERISIEFGRKNFNIIKLNQKSSLNSLIRLGNFFVRLVLSFIIGLAFLFILIGILALLSGLIGFITQNFVR